MAGRRQGRSNYLPIGRVSVSASDLGKAQGAGPPARDHSTLSSRSRAPRRPASAQRRQPDCCQHAALLRGASANGQRQRHAPPPPTPAASGPLSVKPRPNSGQSAAASGLSGQRRPVQASPAAGGPQDRQALQQRG